MAGFCLFYWVGGRGGEGEGAHVGFTLTKCSVDSCKPSQSTINFDKMKERWRAPSVAAVMGVHPLRFPFFFFFLNYI